MQKGSRREGTQGSTRQAGDNTKLQVARWGIGTGNGI